MEAEEAACLSTWVGKSEEVGGCLVHHRELKNGDVSIHYVEAGDAAGELVVLLHGFPEFWYSWKNQFRALVDAGFHVAAPDLRGYNLSSKPKELSEYTGDKVMSDIVLLIDQLAGGRLANVIGHDWGGAITWRLGLMRADKIAKLGVLNMPHLVTFGKALRSSMRQMQLSWYVLFFQLPAIPEKFLQSRLKMKKLYSNVKRPLSEEDLQRHVDAFLSFPRGLSGPLSYYRGMFNGNWPAAEASGAHPAGYIDLPVLYIWGEQEDFFVPELADPPLDLVPNVRVVKIPEASHFVMWDEPEKVNNVLIDFLRGEERGGTSKSRL